MDDFIELATEGFNAALDTDYGDQALHFASNGRRRENAMIDRTDRASKTSKDSSSKNSSTGRPESRADSQRPRRDSHRPEQKKDNGSNWSSLKSLWGSKRSSQQSQPRPAHSSREPGRRSRDDHTHTPPSVNDDEWSRKSYLKTRRYQEPSARSSRDSFESDDEYQEPITVEPPREVVKVWEERCDRLRVAKGAYVPGGNLQPAVTELKWEEERLYDHVGRAVQDAMRRSGEMERRRVR